MIPANDTLPPPLAQDLARVPDGPLYGTLVVAFDQQIAGSLAAEELARQGATVIKVERAGVGDAKRGNGNTPASFNTFNAGKYSVAFDGSEADNETKRLLLKHADVIIDNRSEEAQLRDRVLQESLREKRENPVIYCAISGFGRGAKIPAYDRVVQAASGMADLNGGLIAFPLIDMATGKEAAKDIGYNLLWVSRLKAEERARLGCVRLDVSMVEVAMNLMANTAARYHDERETGSTLVPFGLFDAADGKIAVAVAKDDQYARLCGVLGMSETCRAYETGKLRLAHRAEIEEEMRRCLATHSAAHWQEALAGANVPVQPVLTFGDAFRRYGQPMMQLDLNGQAYVGNVTHSNAFPKNPRIGAAPALDADKPFVEELARSLESGKPLDALLKSAHRDAVKPEAGYYGHFKWVDPKDIDWSQDRCELPWAKSCIYRVKKTGKVKAEKALAGTVLRTASCEEQEITTNVAREGDWKITSPQGNEYYLSDERFRELYFPEADADGAYCPRPQLRQAVTVTEDVQFLAPWGKTQYIPKGGLILRCSDTDIYGAHPDNAPNFQRADWVERIGMPKAASHAL